MRYDVVPYGTSSLLSARTIVRKKGCATAGFDGRQVVRAPSSRTACATKRASASSSIVANRLSAISSDRREYQHFCARLGRCTTVDRQPSRRRPTGFHPNTSGPQHRGPTLVSMIHGSRGWDAGRGDDCEDPPRVFCTWQVDQGDLSRAESLTEGRTVKSHPTPTPSLACKNDPFDGAATGPGQRFSAAIVRLAA